MVHELDKLGLAASEKREIRQLFEFYGRIRSPLNTGSGLSKRFLEQMDEIMKLGWKISFVNIKEYYQMSLQKNDLNIAKIYSDPGPQ